jgi:hypothetical protein
MRGHRVLVFLDDFDHPEVWGFWCADCPLDGFGYATELHPSRLAKRHEKATRPVLQETTT